MSVINQRTNPSPLFLCAIGCLLLFLNTNFQAPPKREDNNFTNANGTGSGPASSASPAKNAGSEMYGVEESDFSNDTSILRGTRRIRHDFINNEFQLYRAFIDKKIETSFPHSEEKIENCTVPPGGIEFGTELRVFTPWANYLRQHEPSCGGKVWTSSTPGSRYMYYFSAEHTILPHGRRAGYLPKGNPFSSTSDSKSSVHRSSIPEGAPWTPPPYKEFFSEPRFFAHLLGDKPLVVILNKYNVEFRRGPENYLDPVTLRELLAYLSPHYAILYKRSTVSLLRDRNEIDAGELGDKDMIRTEFPGVLLFEDFADAISEDRLDDVNLLQFGFLALAEHYIVVQGGTAVLGSYFGGRTFIYAKTGKELSYGDFNYFPRFSNATISVSLDYKSLQEEIYQHFDSLS